MFNKKDVREGRNENRPYSVSLSNNGLWFHYKIPCTALK